jgi:hypothetical protein
MSAFLFLKVHLHYFSKIKKSPKKVSKQQESRVFLLFLLADRRIRIQIHTSDNGSGSRLKNMWIRIRYTGFPGNFYFEALAESSCISMAEGPPPLRPKDISGMEGSMGEAQNVPVPTGSFIHSQN